MSRRTSLRAGRAGFTLIEMMVVVAIIGTLAMVVGPSVFGNVGEAKIVAARSQIEIFSVALEGYRVDTDHYPTTQQGLAALRAEPVGVQSVAGWAGPYVRRSVPQDPWGRPYLYTAPGVHNPRSYDLSSLGRDGVPGGEGEDADIHSWDGGDST